METGSRKLLRSAAITLLPIVLCVFIFSATFSIVFGNPTRIKETVRDSGLYATIMDGILAQTAETNSGTVLAKIPVEQPEIKAVIEQAFPTSTVALQGNQIIDGTYAWLQGDATQPAFSIDLSEGKQRLASGLASHIHQRVPTLPVCTDIASAAAFDPFTSTCRPPGLDINLVAQTVSQQVNESTAFLANPIVTANSFTNDQNEPLPQTASQLPQIYQQLINMPVLMAIVAIVLILISLFLSPDRQRQYTRLSGVIIGTGIFAIVVSFIAGKAWQEVSGTFAENTLNKSPLLLESFLKIINSLSVALTDESILISCAVIACGALLFIIGHTASKSGLPMGKLLTPAPSNPSNPPTFPPPTIQ